MGRKVLSSVLSIVVLIKSQKLKYKNQYLSYQYAQLRGL